MAEQYLGEIRIFGFGFAPQGWASCTGQLLSIQQNTALFSLLGTFYGGNGTQTFGLPDLRGRVPINQGAGPGLSDYSIGEQVGTENNTLTISNLPQHSHLAHCSSANGTSTSPIDNYWAEGNDGGSADNSFGYSTTSTGTMNPNAISVTGGGQPFSVLQPLLVMNYCIALTGIFPTRS
jgi:microcystin-dependent protein